MLLYEFKSYTKQFIMLSNKEKEKRIKLQIKKTNLNLLITAFISILLGVFGIFISHYNGDNFIERVDVDNSAATSTVVSSKVIPKFNNKATADMINEYISPVTISAKTLVLKADLDSVSATKAPIHFQIDTTRINIFQIASLDLFKIDYTIDRARQITSTQN